jgi:membrane associated rhomboid family serine protease
MSEQRSIVKSTIFPLFVCLSMWLIKLYELYNGQDFGFLGIFPRTLHGFFGIFTTPFIHGSISHLVSNTFPFLFLASALIYFYRTSAYLILLIIYIFSGLAIWFFARDAFHIGMSGVIYGMASFLFFTGLVKRVRKLLALSLVIAFLYGGMVWGVLPLEEHISWEAHLFGAIFGAICVFLFRDSGPTRKKYSWELEEEDGGPGPWDIKYIYKPEE